jgi:hypothetical protein
LTNILHARKVVRPQVVVETEKGQPSNVQQYGQQVVVATFVSGPGGRVGEPTPRSQCHATQRSPYA